jgi:hypothetical protein
MSFAGVLFESVFVAAVLARPGLWRALFTASGFALILGFFLFHGLWWWTWLMVYLSFAIPWAGLYDWLASQVPVRTYCFDPSSPRSLRWARVWHGVDWFNRIRFVDVVSGQDIRGGRFVRRIPPVSRGLQPIHWLLIGAVCLHATFELPGGYGRFTSYSHTYQSIEEFERANPLKWVDTTWIRYEGSDAVQVNEQLALDAIKRLMNDEPVPSYYANYFATRQELNRLFGAAPRHLTLTRSRSTFDWERGRFNPRGPQIVVGTLDLDSMTLVRGGPISQRSD